MSEPLTDAEIAELRRLERKASAGPWDAERRGAWDLACDGKDGGRCWVIPNGQNYHFIAAARNALPRLLDEVVRLRAAVAHLSDDGDDPYPAIVRKMLENEKGTP